MKTILRYGGLGLLVVAVWLAIAGSVGWLPDDAVSPWVPLCFKVGAGAIAASLLLGILEPVLRRLRTGRCVRCGAPTERGQAYCLDHLRMALDEYRDQTRPGLYRRPGHRGGRD